MPHCSQLCRHGRHASVSFDADVLEALSGKQKLKSYFFKCTGPLFFLCDVESVFWIETEASFSAGAHSNLDAWRDMKGRFRSTESKQKLLLRCRDAHGEDCSLHVFERPVKPLTDPMLHNGQVPTRHEMLILGGVFYCPADRPCAMFVLGRCLAVSCSFILPLGGRIGKLSFCILSSWIHRVDDEDQSWAISLKRLTETLFWVTARFCYQGWAARWLKSTPHPHLLALHPRRQDNYQNHPSFQISAGYL